MSFAVSHLLKEMSSKSDWYQKVFSDEIIQKWKEEISPEHESDFWLAINILRATAQGSLHLPNCSWEEAICCDDCKEDIHQQVLADSKCNGFESREEAQNAIDEGSDILTDMYYEVECYHPRCDCSSPDHDLSDYIVYNAEGLLDDCIRQSLKDMVIKLSENEPDWHPGSNQQVRDLVHPSLYCYVKPNVPEEERYAWLPSEFEIDSLGVVNVKSYINNLHEKYYDVIERTFSSFIPSLEKVLNKPVRGRTLQVIVKIASIELDETKPNYSGGSWHIEGMPYEYIAATCLHYLTVENITQSYLEFRKPVYVNEENIDYPQSDSSYTTNHYGITPHSHHDGVMNRYLGMIKCAESASVVFPNSLQHRVKEFSLMSGCDSAKRTILAFFVIDPDHKITSTADVPPQQAVMSLEEAMFHRERLMHHRKFFVDKLNQKVFERPFSLCEH